MGPQSPSSIVFRLMAMAYDEGKYRMEWMAHLMTGAHATFLTRGRQVGAHDVFI